MTLRPITAWRGPPLVLQIMALLLGVLVVAQLATLFLMVLLPPAPKAQYGLDDVAAMLVGDPQGVGVNALVRTVQAGPPDITGPGWLNAEKSRVELAGLAGTTPDRVILAFYTPLPFAGTATQRAYAMADDGAVAPFKDARAAIRPIALLQMAGAAPPGGVGVGMRAPQHGDFPRGFDPGGLDRWGGATGSAAIDHPGRPRFPLRDGLATDAAPARIEGASPERVYIPGDGGAAVPALLRGGAEPAPARRAPPPATVSAGAAAPPRVPPPALGEARFSTRAIDQQPLLAPSLSSGAAADPGFAPYARLDLPDRAIVIVPPPSPSAVPRPQPLTPQARSAPLSSQGFATPTVRLPPPWSEALAPAAPPSAFDPAPGGPADPHRLAAAQPVRPCARPVRRG